MFFTDWSGGWREQKAKQDSVAVWSDATLMAFLLASLQMVAIVWAICGVPKIILKNTHKIWGVWNVISNVQQSLSVTKDETTYTT